MSEIAEVSERKRRNRVVVNQRSGPARQPIAGFRGTEAFGLWVADVIKFSRLPASVLIEHALVEWAERHGYPEPAPLR